MKDKPTQQQIEDAIKLLTDAIGCYGHRIVEPISIQWGNGVCLSVSGRKIRGGARSCADFIANDLPPNTLVETESAQ